MYNVLLQVVAKIATKKRKNTHTKAGMRERDVLNLEEIDHNS